MAPDFECLGHHVAPEDKRLARVGCEQRAEDADQGGFTAAVRTEDAGDAAGFDPQVELVQGDLVLPIPPPPRRAGFALAAAKRLSDAVNLNRRDVHYQLLKTSNGQNKRTVAVPNDRTVPD